MSQLFEFEDFLKAHFNSRRPEGAGQELFNSCEYSLFSGGKRFRPMIAMAVAKALNTPIEKVIPFAAAVECVHTYSLIHDDLPALDNDDFRRGRPTNHRVYGEATALLAGDALFTEAFYIIGSHYAENPEVAQKLTFLLSESVGLTGMVWGQVLDLLVLKGEEKPTQEFLELVHKLKTGALIRASAVGAAIIAKAGEVEMNSIDEYGKALGLAFQIADDLLDYDEKIPEKSGFPAVIGLEKTKEMLSSVTRDGLASLGLFKEKARGLRELLEKNIQRDK